MNPTKFRVLFLDDERNPEDVTWVTYPVNSEFVIVRTYDQFVKAIENNIFDYYSFDHDIQDYKNLSTHDLIPTCYGMVELGRNDSKFEFDGLRCMYYLTTQVNNFNTDTVYIHSKNGIGAANMMAYVSQFD